MQNLLYILLFLHQTKQTQIEEQVDYHARQACIEGSKIGVRVRVFYERCDSTIYIYQNYNVNNNKINAPK